MTGSGFQVPVPGQRADAHPVPIAGHEPQAAKVLDVDQGGRGGEPQPHQRQQAVPGGQDLCLVAQVSEYADRLRDGLRAVVIERGRDHAGLPAAGRSAARLAAAAADLRLGRIRVAVEQVPGGQHEPRCAVAALQAWTARIVQDFTASSSSRTVQAPHWLVSQPT